MTACTKTTYVLLPLLILFPLSRACPTVCVCKWKNGKQTVECNNRDLPGIPDGMDPGTQVLEFTENNLKIVTKEKFLRMDLINLQRIYLSRCRISSIDDRTFKGLTNLVELDLSGNLLVSVPTETFIDCPALMKLTLSFNPMRTLRRSAFNHLSYLNTLELTECEISSVEDGAFQGLHSLEWLHLDGNKLTKLRGTRILPTSLRGVDLQGNPWQCDCHIVDLHTWLVAFKSPHSVEPTCIGPSRLVGRAIRSIPAGDLACLPDVSPTTFYLEVGEGKNVSLLCHVHSIPEARVSWWFQGRLLQNDSMIAPGLRLLYFIEEGTQEKRSELFIYNTNSDDNGTFICNAENAAGTSQSNFTIKIVVKEEPIVIIVSFPLEYLLAAVVGAASLALLVVITIVISILKCRRNRQRQLKRDKTKEVALQYQQNTLKCPTIRERENVEQIDQLKENSRAIGIQKEVNYSSHPSEELLRAMSPIVACNQVRSPTSFRRYQLEQNPDLINDTETVGRRREGDGEDERGGKYREALESAQILQFPCCTDVHLNPNCLLDQDGYPVDYGLPKLQARASKPSDNFYRTLPYNRGNKRQTAANPPNRYSREAEFLSRTSQPAAFEHYCPGVRYTADGYPVRVDTYPVQFRPSPPEGYKTEGSASASAAPSSLPCCSPVALQWPHCVPANLHVVPDLNKNKLNNVSKRCVGAQTDNGGDKAGEETERLTSNNKADVALDERIDAGNDTLTESPDEGYEGEPSVV